jgi:serine/threonine-protein kinase
MEPGAAQVSHALGLDLGGVVLDGRYQVIRRIGAGGMASVYEARRVGLERRFAVKILRPELAESESNIKRFLREARAAAAVQHPNIVSIEDVGTATPPVYFVMEYLEGYDLRYELKRLGRIEWPRAQDLALQIVDALSAAHGLGIIHRDVKPANCFLVRDPTGSERLKVLDFGIAKVLEESQEFTQNVTATHGIVGTVAYMAPEQARSATVDARTDVYALGTMLYEMLAGTVPFPDKNPFVVIGRLLGEAAVPLRMHRPDLPPELDAIVMTCLEKDPNARFQSMDALGVALSNCEVAGVVGTARVRMPSGLVRAASVPKVATASPKVVTASPKVTAARLPANVDDDEPTSHIGSTAPRTGSGATAPRLPNGEPTTSTTQRSSPPRRKPAARDSALVGLLVGGIGMVGIGGTATWWALRDRAPAPAREAPATDAPSTAPVDPQATPAATTPVAPATMPTLVLPIPGPTIAVPVPSTTLEPAPPDPTTRPGTTGDRRRTTKTAATPPTDPTTTTTTTVEPRPPPSTDPTPQPKISPDLRNPFTPKK